MYAPQLSRKVVEAGALNGSPGQGKTTTGATGEICTDELDQIRVWVKGITTGTVQVQRTLDGGTTWVNVGSALTADGEVALPAGSHAQACRGNITDATAVAVEMGAVGLKRP